MALTGEQRLANAKALQYDRPPVYNRDGSLAGGGDAGPDSGRAVTRNEFQSDPRTETYTIQQTGVIEECFAQSKCVSASIFATGGTVGGVFQPTAAALTYLGQTRNHLHINRATGDEYVAFEIPETPLSELQVLRLYVKGTAGDVIVAALR